jgi:hypothetical protein
MFGIRQKIRTSLSRRHGWRTLDKSWLRPLSLSDIQKLNLSRTASYFYCDYYFSHFLPETIRRHRKYFSTDGRGFGEDAFHTMWFLLFQEFRPANALEIGVYRGQTITLWKLLAQHFAFECKVACISPFTSVGDSVSEYKTSVDYHADVISNHQEFQLPLPEIFKGLSNSLGAESFIRLRQWDVIYIDGNHDYQVARHDWNLCSSALAPRGLVVLDDSSLGTDFVPPVFSTAGHPGPSKVAVEIDRSQFDEIFAVGHNRVFQRKN